MTAREKQPLPDEQAEKQEAFRRLTAATGLPVNDQGVGVMEAVQ